MGHSADLRDDSSSRRVSRPRLVVSSSSFLKRLEQHHKTPSSLSPSTSYEIEGCPTFARSKSRERTTRQDARSKLRSYLHTSKDGSLDSSDDDDEGQRGLPAIAKGVKHRLSRVGTASSSSQLSSPGASTSQLSSYSNSPSDLVDSARMVEEIKEKAYLDSIAARNHISSPVCEDMHVDSMPSPIRRKSLYTPGIATRTPNDILRKPPPQQVLHSPADREYYFNSNSSTSSPLGRVAALETGKSGRSTPTLNYSHLGGLGLGTLRVTNGPPSPKLQDVLSQPSDTTASYLMDKDQDAGVLAKAKRIEKVGEITDESGSKNEEASNTSASNLPIDNEAKFGHADQRRHRNGDYMIREKTSDSSLKSEYGTDDKDFDQTSGRRAHSKWLTRKHSLPSGFFLTSASELALDYMQELPDTPFRRVQTANNESLKSRCDPNTDDIDDASLEDEGLVMSKSYRSALERWRSSIHDTDKKKAPSGTTADAYRKLNANSACQERAVSRPTSSSASAKTVDSRSICTDPSTLQSSKKSNSSHSSSESLSVSNTAPGGKVAVTDSTPGTLESGSKKSFRLSGSQRLSRSLLRKVRKSDVGSNTDQENPSPPSIAAAVQLATLTTRSSGPERNPSMEKSVSPNHIIPSSRNASKTRRSGNAKRVSQQPPVNSIVVQGARQLSQLHIPDVPKEIALQHAERLRKFPMLEHTFPSSQHVSSDDCRLLEGPRSVPIRFPSPAHTLERADSICKANLDWPSSRSTKSKKIKLVSKSGPTSSSKIARRSSQIESVTAITDFGTVTECLGSSPYDIAKPATSNAWKRASISHPHQISTAMPRTKSMIVLTHESASQIADSQNRFSTQSSARPPIPSFRSFDSLDQISGRTMRPHCTIDDAPPVPTLPVRYSTREVKHSDPQSLGSSRQEPSENQVSDMRSEPQNSVSGAKPIPTISVIDSDESKSLSTPQPFEPRRKSFNDRGGRPGKLTRPMSMVENAPPVPVLPSKSELKTFEAKISKSVLRKSTIAAAPTETREPPEEKIVVESSTAETLNASDSWKLLREAWSQRRKSAGDALLLRSQAQRSYAPTALDEAAVTSDSCQPTGVSHHPSHTSSHLALPLVKQRRPPLRHIYQSQGALPAEADLTASFQDSRLAKKSTSSTSAHFSTLADRFAGGFHYGYEPGFGLGGSAGMRIAKSTASRKSVNMSRGYGLDLSDVPVFLTPR